MPIYSYACPSCGDDFERYLPLSRWQEVQFCLCGHPVDRIIGVPLLVRGQPECRYDSPIDRTPITSWAARREDLARNNCVPYEPEQKQDYLTRMKDNQEQLDKSLDQTVECEIERMPTAKRAALAYDLEAGSTVDYLRL